MVSVGVREQPQISVIVCTRNRAALLRRCVLSLIEDSTQTHREIIVVDNGSSDGTRHVVEALGSHLAPNSLRYVLEPTPGKSRALNAGVRAADGDLLLFTDDDATVRAGWTEAIVSAFGDPAVGAAGGRTLPLWVSPPPAWLAADRANDLGLRDHGETDREIGWQDVIGVNMAVRAEVVRTIDGPFAESLGPRGAVRLDFEESYLLEQVSRTQRIAYCARAVVMHRIDPARVTPAYLRRLAFQRGFGMAQVEILKGTAQRPLLRRAARAARVYSMALCSRRSNTDPGDDPEAARLEAWNHSMAGREIGRTLARVPRLSRWAARRLP